jgi:uncharacterized membrane protein YoaK (UPF0700 family)
MAPNEYAHGRPGTRRLAVLLAGIAGAVDAIGYLALAHLFTAHMSGNTVALGASVGGAEPSEVVRRVLAIVLFAAGIAVGTAVGEIRADRGRRHPTVPIFGVEMVLLLAFIVLGVLERMPSPEEPRFYVLLAFPTLAMGMQSATVRRIGHLNVTTTYISGVLTSFIEGIVRQMLHRSRQEDFGVRLFGSVWGAYLLGAVAGGVSYSQVGPVATLLPIAGLVFVVTFDLLHPYELATEFTPS